LRCALTSDYDVFNGSVFQVAADLNGVPYIPSKSLLENPATNSSSTHINGLPSDSAARKVLPVFIIFQLGLSALTIAGAFWLAWGDDMSKYDRLGQDRSTTLIPASKLKVQHQKYSSIASDTPFATELERGFGEHHPRDSVVDLTSSAALMGTSSPPRRHSDESEHSQDDHEDVASLRRMLDSNPAPGRGFLEHRRNSLFLD